MSPLTIFEYSLVGTARNQKKREAFERRPVRSRRSLTSGSPSHPIKGDPMSLFQLFQPRRSSSRRSFALAVFLISAVGVTSARADDGPRAWITSWAASPQGPYPSGAAVAQPDLGFAFPANSANEQTFRLIVRPDLWSSQMRVRFTNLVGNQPV